MARRRYKKPYRAKKRKPFFYKPSFWLFAVFLTGMSGLAWLVCFSETFEVKTVKVLGSEKIAAGECRDIISKFTEKQIAFLPSKSILLFDAGKANKEILAKFPQIKDIKIERKFPGEILASVQEREPAAVLNWRDSQYFFIDETGVAYGEAESSEDFFTIKKNDQAEDIRLGSEAINAGLLVKILRFRASLENDLKIGLSQALAVTSERVNFKTDEGWEIFINPEKDLDWQIAKLQAVVNDPSFAAKRSNLEYLDLRFTRVYLKSRQTEDLSRLSQDKENPEQSVSQNDRQTKPADPNKPLD